MLCCGMYRLFSLQVFRFFGRSCDTSRLLSHIGDNYSMTFSLIIGRMVRLLGTTSSLVDLKLEGRINDV